MTVGRPALTICRTPFTALAVSSAYTLAQTVPTLTTLHSFTGGSDGEALWGGVVIGSAGVLYGTSGGGGTSSACYEGCGKVFSLTPPASPGSVWTEAVLYSFTGGDGAGPEASVVIGSGGVLYGTTEYGGTGSCSGTGCGTVFSLTPPLFPGGTWTQTVLHNFTGSPGDGAIPQAALVIGGDGVLYGTTTYGGSGACVPPGSGTGCGTVFSLTPPAAPGGAWTETVLYNFTGYPTVGTNPYAGVVVGSGGALYGTTQYGGASGNGTVYSLTPPAGPGSAWTGAVLYAFSGASDGSVPVGGVVIGNGGVLYGTTELGGTGTCTGQGIFGCGTAFSLTPPTSAGGAWTQTVLYSFTGTDRLRILLRLPWRPPPTCWKRSRQGSRRMGRASQ